MNILVILMMYFKITPKTIYYMSTKNNIFILLFFSDIAPNISTSFIPQIMLSMGHFGTEIDILIHRSI